MHVTVPELLAYLAALAAIFGIIGNSIKIYEFLQPRVAALFKKSEKSLTAPMTGSSPKETLVFITHPDADHLQTADLLAYRMTAGMSLFKKPC